MIHFTSDNLNRYIAFKLGVERLNFELFELAKLKELEIDPCADNLYFEVSSDILEYFVSLESLTIKNMPIDEKLLEEIIKLSNLKSLKLVNSSVFDIEKLSNKKLTNLTLNNTYINNVDKLNNFKFLNKLSLIDMKKIDILFLKDLPNLSSLSLTNTKVERESMLSIFNLLEYLAIDNTEIKDLSFLNEMTKLKVLIIDSEIYDNNLKLINSLLKRNVCVLENGIHNLSIGRYNNEI